MYVCMYVNRGLGSRNYVLGARNYILGARNYVVEIKCDVTEKACGIQEGNENCLNNFDHEETTYGSKYMMDNTIKIYLREMG